MCVLPEASQKTSSYKSQGSPAVYFLELMVAHCQVCLWWMLSLHHLLHLKQHYCRLPKIWQNVKMLPLLPNIIHPTHFVLSPSYPDMPTVGCTVSTSPEKDLFGHDPSWAMGPDGISAHVLKSCSACLVFSLFTIVSVSAGSTLQGNQQLSLFSIMVPQ